MTSSLPQREQYAKGGVGRWYWDYRDQRTLSSIKDEKFILDVGCGEGITLQKLLKKFPDRIIHGLDYEWDNVAVCKTHNLPAQRGSAYELAFEDQSFDCCLFLEVIEHLLDPEKALREIHRVLRKGGLLLVIFPHDWLFKAARLFFMKLKEAFTPSGHVKQWQPAEMRKTLNDVGFEIQEMTYMPFFFWWCSLHCLVAARKK